MTAYNFDVETYTARDEEGEAITWHLSGNDASDFLLHPSTGTLTFFIEPNYEMPAGSPATPGDPPDNTYEIIVQARDNSGNTRDYPVTVTNVDETPEITGGDASPSFVEIAYDAVNPDLTVGTAYTARDEESQTIT